MITNFFIPELNNHDVQELWFQQDGATCHTARATIDLLKDTFGDRLISRFGTVNWPPRSCDLTPLDYFLWVYVKSLVYADKPQTLDHLKDNIRRVIDDIRPQMLEKVIENWTSRLDYIRASRGSPMPEIIFKIRHIKNFAKRALPLTNLLRKHTPFEWTSETHAAFDDIKEAILNPPVLVLPDPDAELQITTDASSHGIEAVLKQKYPNSEVKPIYFFSKKLNSSQFADHLSRYINNITIALPESKDLIEMQREDPVLSHIIQKIHQNDVSPQISSYFIIGDGLLCHLSKRPSRSPSCQVIYSQFGLAIHQNDHQARRRFVEWAQNEIAVVPDFHKRILFSDEAHFWLNGYVNKQNCRIWSEANPQVYVETPLHPEKLTVWCALWAGGIIGPYFFKNDEGHNFQQDGTTCHTARATIDLLKDTFGDRLISRFGPVSWPPRSCDLTPLDYFLWGYVKSLVYADKPQTLDHLEDNIRRVIADIRPQMLEKVIENWTSRLDYIRASRGSHMPEIIFKM
ncbi:transposable element Tc3 transposase [Trichonephila clavipes]|uniref:Transposable element Tc3 transposase n=1 Tax=Trichonephila clavipes TaxID=2585209 RepID=A0A8X6WG13_TRICX|nr:transposable element Tc3 transposase [Trichonephila clavipes]